MIKQEKQTDQEWLVWVENQLEPQRRALSTHRMYSQLSCVADISVFMESHVYPVWDFMSLLKALQVRLTTVQVPWVPAVDAAVARLVNEIVLGEETDVNEAGEPMSHFEMYRDAMLQVGADVAGIDLFVRLVKSGESVRNALIQANAPEAARVFVEHTFSVIDTGKPHLIAAAFTFGREDLIPDMFVEILKQADAGNTRYDKLRYYLDRHIELDGDEHGPLSLQMVSSLCEGDPQKWHEVLETAQRSLDCRIELWDAVADQIALKLVLN